MSLHDKWAAAARRAQEKGLSFTISQRELYELIHKQRFVCALSGRKIGFGDDVDGSDTASIDRIDSAQGYRLENVQWVHKEFNRMKNCWSQDKFVEMCVEVTNQLAVPSHQFYMKNYQQLENSLMLDDTTAVSNDTTKVSNSFLDSLPTLAKCLPAEDFLQMCIQWSNNHNPFSTIIEISPKLAACLLENNPENRNISIEKVKQYVRDLRSGNWSLNGETVIVANTGELNDGQHRLKAGVETGIAFMSAFCVGVDRGSRKTVDTGRVRTSSDHLLQLGFRQTKALAQAVSLINCYEKHHTMVMIPERRSTQSELVAALTATPEIDADRNRSIGYQVKRTFGISQGLFMALYYLCARHNRDVTDEFFNGFITGTNLDAGNPMFVLRESLLKNDKKVKDRAGIADLAARTIKAFNSFVEGRTIKNLSWRKKGNAVEPFPMIGQRFE